MVGESIGTVSYTHLDVYKRQEGDEDDDVLFNTILFSEV